MSKFYNKLSKGAKATFWFTFCSLLQKGISFIATPIYTRLLTEDQYGLFAVYQSWLSIITILATLCLSAGVFNNLLVNKERYNATDNQILSSVQVLEIITIILVSAIFIGITQLFPSIMGIDLKMAIMISVYILFSSAFALFMGKEKFRFKFKYVVILSLLTSILTVAVNVLLIIFIDDKDYALIYGTTLVVVILYIPLLISNLIQGKRIIDLKIWKYALLFNLPLLPHYLSMTVLASSDRIMIESICSTSAAALYSVPYNVANLASIFITAINSSLVPSTYQKLKARDLTGFDKSINLILLFFVIIVFGICILGPEVVRILGGNSYMEAIWVIPPVAGSMFFMFLYPIFGNVEFFYEKKWFTMIASVIAAVANIGLNYLFIPMYGYFAASFTTLICYILLALAHYIAYKIICKQQALENVYDEKIIFLLSIVVLGVIAVSYLLYLNNIVRYVIVGGLVLCFLILIKPIIKIIKNIFTKNKSTPVVSQVLPKVDFDKEVATDLVSLKPNDSLEIIDKGNCVDNDYKE